MACNYSFFLIALAVFSAAAHGRPTTYEGVTVEGQLCCTPSGNCPGRPVNNQTVGVYSGRKLVGQNLTTDGLVTINATLNWNVTAAQAAQYLAVVNLPVSSRICRTLSVSGGQLRAPIRINGSVGGYLQGTISRFFYVNTTQS